MSTKMVSDRPPKVALAVKLFYIVVGIGVTRSAITIFRHADVRSPHFFILLKLLIYIVSLFLIYQLGKGKNWARFSMVAILIISIPLVIIPNFHALSHNPVHSILGILNILLYITGLALIFHRSSSPWFRSKDIGSKQDI